MSTQLQARYGSLSTQRVCIEARIDPQSDLQWQEARVIRTHLPVMPKGSRSGAQNRYLLAALRGH